MAVGAFTAAQLRIHGGLPTLLAALAGAAAAALAGVVVGAGVVRLQRGLVAVATWLFAWTCALALAAFPSVSGGAEGLLLPQGPSTATLYELALALVALAALGYAALAHAPFGLRLAAARLHRPAAAAAGVPVARLRLAAFAAAAAVGGLAGGLAVQLAAVADAATFSPFLSFKLFVAVLIGGALAALGPLAGVIALGLVSAAAGAVGSAEGVSATRFHPLLASVLLLAVLAMGGEGLLRPGARRRSRLVTLCYSAGSGRLAARGLRKVYGELVALEGLDLELSPGEIVALTGPNGSGKTTALRLLAGTARPDGGTVTLDCAVARTLQATATFGELTPLEHALVASRRQHSGPLRTLFSTPKARAEAARAEAEARGLLERFGLGAQADTRADQLTHAEQRLLAVATAAATGAGVLLLDEPSAGAAPADIARLESVLRALAAEGTAILLVEHNLRLVRSVADRVVALDAGRVA